MTARLFPLVNDEGKTVRVVAGSVYGARSPVATASETLFADVTLAAGTTLPVDADTEERAVYLLFGEVDLRAIGSAPAASWCFVPATASRSPR